MVPADPEPAREAVANRWYYEGRKKDTPEPYPLPSDYKGDYLEGLQTQSGKYEFIAESLRKIEREAWPRATIRPARRSTGTCRPTKIRPATRNSRASR